MTTKPLAQSFPVNPTISPTKIVASQDTLNATSSTPKPSTGVAPAVSGRQPPAPSTVIVGPDDSGAGAVPTPRKSVVPLTHGRRFSGPAARASSVGHPAGVLFGLGTAREVLRQHIGVLMAQVEGQRAKGEIDTALGILQKIEALHPGPPRVELGEVRANLLIDGDRLTEASRILAWVMVNSKTASDRNFGASRKFATVQLTLADRMMAKGEWAAALAGLDLATLHHPRIIPEDRLALWSCFRAKGKCLIALEEFTQYFQTAEAVLGHSASLEALQGAVFPVAAVECLDCQFDLTAEGAVQLLRERATVHLTVNNLAGAVADTDTAVRILPDDGATLVLVESIKDRIKTEFAAAQAEYDRGDYAIAARRSRSLVEAQPMDFRLTTLLGQSLLKQGAPLAAVAAFADALDIAMCNAVEAEPIDGEGMPRPKTPTQAARYRVAAALYSVALRCSVTDAIETLTEAIWLNSDDPEFFLARARCQVIVGSQAAAVNDFKDALYLEPDNLEAAVELSSLLSEQVLRAFDNGELIQASRILRTAIEYNSGSPALHTALAVTMSYMDDADQALEQAHIAAVLEPGNTDAIATYTRLKTEGAMISTTRFEPPGFGVPLPPIRPQRHLAQ